MRKHFPATVCAALLLAWSSARAHHSPFLFFDPAVTTAAEGEIVGVRWRNPHAEFILSVKAPSGENIRWVLETHSVSILRRMQLDRDVIQEGINVKVVGWPAKRGGNEMFVTNMLLPDGREIIFHPGAEARWSDRIEGDPATWLITEGQLADSDDDAEGIFHVWSTSLANGEENLLFEAYDFPLTSTAAASRAEYDIYSNPILGSCAFKGMPTIMEQPYPMQFRQDGDYITMHMEEGDTIRAFHMSRNAIPQDEAPTPLGYSVGRWEGDVLVVSTTGSSWPYTDMTGVPNSPDAEYVERFVPSPDGKRLDYTLTITSPKTFTKPVEFTKSWLWVAGEEVSRYDCED